jgi:broad specificity phosphatase PhoE
MRKLILVRHSISKLDNEIPPHQWGLTEEGEALCPPLAEKLSVHHPKLIVTSEEPKAHQTGELIAAALEIPCQVGQDLHEHRRQGGKITTRDEFISLVRELFAQPDRLVFGLETGAEALSRFSRALEKVMADNPQDCIAVVTHGTVMSLYYGLQTGEGPFTFWQGLGLPAFYVLQWPGGEVLEKVMEI